MKELRKVVLYPGEQLEQQLSVDEFIRREATYNHSIFTIVPKDDLVSLAADKGIKGASRMRKQELYDALIDQGMEPRWVAETYGIGVSSKAYQTAFGISHDQVKQAERDGLIAVVGEREFTRWGKHLFAPVYDLYQYAEMDKWIGEPNE